MHKTLSIPTEVCVCDRCGRVMGPNDIDENQERLTIDFRAGYGSVFGDGNQVQLDLCQHCVKKVLGRWLRIVSNPPAHIEEQPHRAWQSHQHPPKSLGGVFLRAGGNAPKGGNHV